MTALKEIQKKYIVDKATELFLKRSINDVTISDIAKYSDVGEATIYRYFGKKQNIVILSCEELAKTILSRFKEDKNVTGINKMENFYNIFLEVYKENRVFYKFINEFDATVLISKDKDVSSYEDLLSSFKDIFDNAYNLGLKDGTIKEIEDKDTFYFATTHSLLNLCKKLADDIELIHQDTYISKEKEIEIMTLLILQNIKNN